MRRLRIPCRYVSGYLFHSDQNDRSLEGATHAWVEAFLPDLGWIAFDPTNNLTGSQRHIRHQKQRREKRKDEKSKERHLRIRSARSQRNFAFSWR